MLLRDGRASQKRNKMKKSSRILSFVVISLVALSSLFGEALPIVQKNRDDYLKAAAFWIHPGLSKDAVVRFIGEPDFTNKKNNIYLYIVEPDPAVEGNQKDNRYIRVFLDKKNEVIEVRIEKFELVQTSKKIHALPNK